MKEGLVGWLGELLAWLLHGLLFFVAWKAWLLECIYLCIVVAASLTGLLSLSGRGEARKHKQASFIVFPKLHVVCREKARGDIYSWLCKPSKRARSYNGRFGREKKQGFFGCSEKRLH